MSKSTEKLTNSYVTEEKLNSVTKNMMFLYTGVILVLGLGFITLLIAIIGPIIDAYRFKADTYQNLVTQVVKQNNDIQTLINKIDYVFYNQLNGPQKKLLND